MDDPVWDLTVFTKNREWLLRGDIARAFFERVLAQEQGRHLLSGEHFTVDGTLIWPSPRSGGSSSGTSCPIVQPPGSTCRLGHLRTGQECGWTDLKAATVTAGVLYADTIKADRVIADQIYVREIERR